MNDSQIVQSMAIRGLHITERQVRRGRKLLEARGLLGDDVRTSLYVFLSRISPYGTHVHGLSQTGEYSTFPGWRRIRRQLRNLFQIPYGTDHDRNTALMAVFGSDAIRAALVFGSLSTRQETRHS